MSPIIWFRPHNLTTTVRAIFGSKIKFQITARLLTYRKYWETQNILIKVSNQFVRRSELC